MIYNYLFARAALNMALQKIKKFILLRILADKGRIRVE